MRASTLRVAYGTSKAGLAHLTKQAAVELAAHAIRVNAVAPGPVGTAMARAVHSAAIRADDHDAIPLRRYGLEGELAEVVALLRSNRASYVTGQLERHGPAGLLLHDGGARPNRVAEVDVGDAQADEVAAAQLAVEGEVEQGEVARAALVLEAGADGPDVLRLERRLRPDDLVVVPGAASSSVI